MIIDSEDLLDYHRSRWPVRFARNCYAAAALRSEYVRGFNNCSCGWNERDDDEPDDQDGCVLGDRCCCPHPFHGPDECFTPEDAEDYERDLKLGEVQP
jgi:hypothetical protein